jgi:hypothetical protein
MRLEFEARIYAGRGRLFFFERCNTKVVFLERRRVHRPKKVPSPNFILPGFQWICLWLCIFAHGNLKTSRSLNETTTLFCNSLPCVFRLSCIMYIHTQNSKFCLCHE